MEQPCWMDWMDRVVVQKYFMFWLQLLLVEMWNFVDWIQSSQGLFLWLRKYFEAFKTFLLEPLPNQRRLFQRSTSFIVNFDHSSHSNHCLDSLLYFSFSFLTSIFYRPLMVFSAYIRGVHPGNTTSLRLNKEETLEEAPPTHQEHAYAPHSNEHGSIAHLLRHICTYLLMFCYGSRLICNWVDWKESQLMYASKGSPGNIHNFPSFHHPRYMDNALGHKRIDKVVF